MARTLFALCAAGWMAIVVAASDLPRTTAGVARPRFEAGATAAVQQDTTAARDASSQRALLDRYCVTCHNQRLKTAGLALDTADLSAVGQDAELWEKVVRKLR